jgi:hypothetical protein
MSLACTRIAADEALDPGQNLRSGPQITEIRKPTVEPLCLAVFNDPLTVASWLRTHNTALLALAKDHTSFERSRSEAGCDLSMKRFLSTRLLHLVVWQYLS